MGNYGSDLISSQPTTNYKEHDRQAEANNQKRRINSAEYLFDKQRENSGVDCDQTCESDWKQPAWRKQSPHDCDYQAGRKNNGKKEGGGNASDGRGYKGHEGQRQYGPAQIG